MEENPQLCCGHRPWCFQTRAPPCSTVQATRSTFRGSVARCKGESRRITTAKALSVASPVNVISKVKVLKGKMLGEGGGMAINCLNEQCIVELWDLCGEIEYGMEGTKGANMFVTFKPEFTVLLL